MLSAYLIPPSSYHLYLAFIYSFSSLTLSLLYILFFSSPSCITLVQTSCCCLPLRLRSHLFPLLPFLPLMLFNCLLLLYLKSGLIRFLSLVPLCVHSLPVSLVFYLWPRVHFNLNTSFLLDFSCSLRFAATAALSLFYFRPFCRCFFFLIQNSTYLGKACA